MAGAKGRSGGQRSGAGRKAATARILALRGGQDRGVVRPVEASPVPVRLPEGLSLEIAAVWDNLAPHAIKAATLVAGTVPAFVRLCQAVVKHGQLDAQIAHDGLTYLKVTIDGAGQEHTEIKAHPLISRAESMDNKIRGWFKDFGINPFGKPLADATPKPADPFAEFEKRVG